MTKMQGRSSGRPTLVQVAERAGVSQITASRALRGVATVDPDLAEKVRAAALAVGYVPNPAAQALASARSRSVLVLLPALSNHLFIATFEAIQHRLRPHGYETLMGNSHYSPAEEEALIRHYLAYKPSAVIATGFDRTEAARAMLENAGIPCVYIMELGPPDAVSVGFSQQAAGAAVARHLIERGRRRLAFVGAQLDARVMQRRDGFLAAIAACGLAPAVDMMTPEPSSIALGGRLFETLRRDHPAVDGVFFCNDDLAFGGIYAAQRAGVGVPAQMSFVGFNDLPGADQIVPRLTSVRTPREEIGARAADAVLRHLQGRALEGSRLDLGFDLVIRESS